MIKLGAKELRRTEAPDEHTEFIKKNPLYIIVDNVLDTYNIGAIFRLADALAVKKVFLCGGTETPPHTRIKKSSINTTEWVPWEYQKSALDAIQKLRGEIPAIQIVSVEQSPTSVPYTNVDYHFPIALVVGHESEGVGQDTMEASDVTVELPMWGVNKSLNVMVSLGIVLYEVAKGLK